MKVPRTPRRPVATLALGVSALAIGLATLGPMPVADAPAPPWCLVCGEQGGVDLLQNVLLFLPLGATACARFGARRRAVLLAAVLSTGIEVAQRAFIPGREGTLGDVAANTAGALLGAALWRRRRALLAPGATRPQRATALALAGWGTAVLAGAVLATPGHPGGPVRLEYRPPNATGARFAGAIDRLALDALPLPDGTSRDLPPPSTAPSVLDASVTRTGARDDRVVLARASAAAGAVFTLGQIGETLTCQRFLRAGLLHLRQPALRVVGAFRNPAPRPPRRLEVRCTVAPGWLAVTTDDGRQRRAARLRLSTRLGWYLLLPMATLLPPFSEPAGLAWLLVLAIPVGYCLPRAPVAGHAWRRARLAVPGVAWILLVLALASPADATAGERLADAGATAAGIATGLALGHLAACRARLLDAGAGANIPA